MLHHFIKSNETINKHQQSFTHRNPNSLSPPHNTNNVFFNLRSNHILLPHSPYRPPHRSRPTPPNQQQQQLHQNHSLHFQNPTLFPSPFFVSLRLQILLLFSPTSLLLLQTPPFSPQTLFLLRSSYQHFHPPLSNSLFTPEFPSPISPQSRTPHRFHHTASP